MSDYRIDCKVCAAVVAPGMGTICAACVNDIQRGLVPKALAQTMQVHPGVLPPQLMQSLQALERSFGMIGVSMDDAAKALGAAFAPSVGMARLPGESDHDLRERIKRAIGVPVKRTLTVGERIRVTGGLHKGLRGTLVAFFDKDAAKVEFDDGGRGTIALERLEALPDPAALRKALAELEEVTRG